MLTATLEASWTILRESAFFVLVGFLIAGALHVFVPRRGVIRLLSAARSRSVFLASAIGLPLPLCSCSVLPAAVTLRQKGASKGATLSFLISTPETSVTYGLLGPTMAIFRPIAACITAIAAGLIENFMERRHPSGPAPAAPADADAACACHDDRDLVAEEVEPETGSRLTRALRYGFLDLFDDIFGWVLLGVVVAAVIQVVLPDVVFSTLFRGSFQSMLVMLVVGVPLYVCAEASTPIAAAFMLQGLNPGAALVLLLVGPATNIGSLGVLHRLLGRRTIVVYLVTIVIVALVMGTILNSFLAQTPETMAVRVMNEPLVPQWLKVAGAITFLALSVRSARRKRYLGRSVAWLDRRLPIAVTSRRVGTAVGVILAGSYLGSGFFAVEPGEVGVVKRFGGIHRASVPPGLHYAAPYPVDAVDRVPVQRVNRLVLGFKKTPQGERTSESDPEESWSLAGDENITDIKSVVHWGTFDNEPQIIQFQYGVGDREGLVRNVVQAVMREVLGGGSIDTVFTADRRELEQRIEGLAQRRLDAYDSGIRVYAFHFLDAHAPPQVHEAFRNVASAMEDKATRTNQALEEQAKIVPAARGEAKEQLEQAAGYTAKVTAAAKGEADRFLDVLGVYHDWPDVTRRRLYFETLDDVLPGVPKYVKPPGREGGDIEIWFVEPQAVGRTPLPLPETTK
jgi:HflK protein